MPVHSPYLPLGVPSAMMVRTACPRCDETDYEKNGKTHHGKQNYQCHRRGREFIQDVDREPISLEQQALIKKLLLEQLSLRGICRVAGVSLGWLLKYWVSLYEALPDHLRVDLKQMNNQVLKRISRLVRATLSFSKKLANHIGAIHYFPCHYNFTLAAEFTG